MILIGHIGLATPVLKKLFPELRFVNIAFGTIAPDLLDKALYYGFYYALDPRHPVFHWITGTRTVGHSGIAACILMLVTMASRRVSWMGFSLGWVSHLLLDFFTVDLDRIHSSGMSFTLLYPFDGTNMLRVRAPFTGGMYGHMVFHSQRWGAWLPEIIGALLLWAYAVYDRRKKKRGAP